MDKSCTKCFYCQESVHRSQIRHLKEFHPEKLHKCKAPCCEFDTSSRRHLDLHVKTCHHTLCKTKSTSGRYDPPQKPIQYNFTNKEAAIDSDDYVTVYPPPTVQSSSSTSTSSSIYLVHNSYLHIHRTNSIHLDSGPRKDKQTLENAKVEVHHILGLQRFR